MWKNWVVGETLSLPILKAAFDKGVNTWDTCKQLPFFHLLAESCDGGS